MSSAAPPDKQGELFAGVSMLDGLGRSMETWLFGFIYSHTVSALPGASFVVGAGINCVIICLLMMVACGISGGHKADATVTV